MTANLNSELLFRRMAKGSCCSDGATSRTMVLDFSGHPDLYTLLRDRGIDEAQVVELLSLLVDGRLRQVKSGAGRGKK